MTERVDEAAYRKRLLHLRAELTDRSASAREAGGTVELDQTRVGRLSRMDALQGQAMAQETARRREVELKRIAAALKRLDEGEYGYCVRCGDMVEPARLTLDPAVPTCVTCAAR